MPAWITSGDCENGVTRNGAAPNISSEKRSAGRRSTKADSACRAMLRLRSGLSRRRFGCAPLATISLSMLRDESNRTTISAPRPMRSTSHSGRPGLASASTVARIASTAAARPARSIQMPRRSCGSQLSEENVSSSRRRRSIGSQASGNSSSAQGVAKSSGRFRPSIIVRGRARSLVIRRTARVATGRRLPVCRRRSGPRIRHRSVRSRRVRLRIPVGPGTTGRATPAGSPGRRWHRRLGAAAARRHPSPH